MSAIRIIDDHLELANIGSKTHAQIEAHVQGIGNYAFPVADGALNQILETDGAGVLSWVNKPAVFACANLSACSLNQLGTRPHSQLTDIGTSDHHARYTNTEAVAAADASDKFLERNVDNTVTTSTSLSSTSIMSYFRFYLTQPSSLAYGTLMRFKVICTSVDYQTMIVYVTFPAIDAQGTDGVEKHVGNMQFMKGSGLLSSAIQWQILDAGGNIITPFALYHDRIEGNNVPIIKVADPTNAQDAATKNYVDTYGPKRYNQSAEPTLNDREMCIWRDTDDAKVYLIYRDETSGQKKVEMT